MMKQWLYMLGALLFAALAVHHIYSPGDWQGITGFLGKEYAFIVIFVGFGTVLWLLGVREQVQHYHNLRQVPIRIHVNGIRGKSTVTRLIGAALREAGYRTLTKTTGKAARLIDEDGVEHPIVRKGKPNIREQIDVMNTAVERGVDALVIECMALHPELQRVSEHKIIQSTIGVITNVRTDHLDVMGPELSDVARSLSNTIPRNGTLVTAERRFLPVLEETAREVGAGVIVADPEGISDEYISSFSYLSFKENIAIALEVTRLLGIDDETAMRGMLKAEPDPGTMRIYRPTAHLTFVNAFGVNDKDSTVTVYHELKRRGFFRDKMLVGVFHARGDRVTRTTDFGRAMVKEMQFDRIILAGKMTSLFIIEAVKNGYPKENILDLGECRGRDVVDAMKEMASDRDVIFFGCGNMVGDIPREIISIVGGDA